MNQALPSAAVKTSAPARRSDTIPRPRLLALMRANLGKRLTLITAPSGFGKTALLADFVAELEQPCAWLSLDAWDRDGGELLASLARALGSAEGVAAPARAPLDDLRRQLRLLVWSALADGPRVIVLDDFQTIEGSREALALVEELIASAPETCHIVISSRDLPRLAGLARLVARGAALWLGLEDLAFDHDEVRRFFREVRETEIDDREAQALLEATGGWAAHLALLTVGEAGTIESTPRAELLLDDLLSEAFNRQTPALRRFLLSTSLLKVLDPSFCDELLERKDSRDILKELERRNLFATRVEADPPVYRLHQPFRAYLKGKLRAEKGNRFATLALKAGQLCEARGDWEGAVSFYIEGQVWPDAVRALRAASESMLAYGRAATLHEWLEALPREVVQTQPDLLLLRARVKVDLGELDAALQVISDLLEDEAPETVRGLALLYRGVCLSRKGQHQEAVKTCRAAASLLTRAGAPPQVEAEANLWLGVAIGAGGGFARAVPPLRKALALAEKLGDVRTASIAADDLAVAFGNLGQIDQAQMYLERARQGWASLGNDYRLVLTLNNLGMMYSLQGEYEESSHLLAEAIERSRATGNARIEAIATLSLADVKRDTGHYDQAIDLYNDGLDKARRLGEAYFVDYAVDALGMTYMLMGDLQKAESLIRHAAAEVGERGGVYENGLLSLSLGILSHLRGEFPESAARLQYALRVFRAAGAAREEARALFHLAHVYLATNSRRRALAALQDVVRLVREIGYSAFLAADARRCPALTAFASSKRLGDGLFARLREEQGRRVALDLGLGPSYPPVEARGFGETSVEIDGRLITDSEWSSVKSKEMFFFFLAARQPASRDECCAALWPEFDRARATSNFHSTLYRLRSATYFDVITNANGRYRLNPAAPFSFDVREFERYVQDGDSLPVDDPERLRCFERAAEIYTGPFARDFYSEWADELRQRLEDEYLRVAAILAGAAFADRAYDRCIELCDRILAIDDSSEEARCLKIESYIELGDRASAVRHFESYRRFLAAEASMSPSRRLAEISRRLSAGRA
ncbi:MAG TPA: tetratricopeptide repeat protein [Dehalococcoidia bacterium]|nr:tetratricopeptide repeat protein [Dehalococcoidia bacterium]